MAKITSSSREEETRSKTFLVGKISGDRTSNSGLASAGHPVQPEDALVIRIVTPLANLVEDINSGISKALRLILTRYELKAAPSASGNLARYWACLRD